MNVNSWHKERERERLPMINYNTRTWPSQRGHINRNTDTQSWVDEPSSRTTVSHLAQTPATQAVPFLHSQHSHTAPAFDITHLNIHSPISKSYTEQVNPPFQTKKKSVHWKNSINTSTSKRIKSAQVTPTNLHHQLVHTQRLQTNRADVFFWGGGGCDYLTER